MEQCLLTGIATLAGVCTALFWQLMKARQDLVDALRELLPLTVQVTKALESLEQQTEKLAGEVRNVSN